MTVGELLRRMDSREITEWLAYFQLRHEEANPAPPSTAATLRAQFAHRVVKKSPE